MPLQLSTFRGTNHLELVREVHVWSGGGEGGISCNSHQDIFCGSQERYRGCGPLGSAIRIALTSWKQQSNPKSISAYRQTLGFVLQPPSTVSRTTSASPSRCPLPPNLASSQNLCPVRSLPRFFLRGNSASFWRKIARSP